VSVLGVDSWNGLVPLPTWTVQTGDDYSSKSPFAPALARRSRRGREINIHLSTTSSMESRARVRAVDDAPSLVVPERPSREGSSRRHVGGHVRDERRARARSMRVEIRAKGANNSYQRTFQSMSPSVHELAFEDVSRVDINQQRRCDAARSGFTWCVLNPKRAREHGVGFFVFHEPSIR